MTEDNEGRTVTLSVAYCGEAIESTSRTCYQVLGFTITADCFPPLIIGIGFGNWHAMRASSLIVNRPSHTRTSSLLLRPIGGNDLARAKRMHYERAPVL